MASWSLILLSSILLNLAFFVHAQPSNSQLYNICGSSGNYSSNSIYHSNLNNLLSSLRSDDKIDYGFYNFSEGNNTDTVNAIALCRGDKTTAECRNCLNVSTHDLPLLCPTQKEATVWYDDCMLRYSNKTIFHTLESDAAYIMWNPNNVTNETLFNQALDKLLADLTDKASSGDSTSKFAMGQANPMNFERLYALVQCTPDLSQLDCGNCLNKAFANNIRQYMEGKQGGRALGPSCHFRYESYLFYTTPSPPPPPSPIASQPPSAPSNSSTPTNSSFKG